MKAASLSLVAVLVFLVACQSAPPPLTPTDSAEVYFQRAQAASDQSQYEESLSIYQQFLTNHPEATHEESFSARYEIALLLSKKGLTAEAMNGYQSILDDFEVLDKSKGAPGWVKVLSQKKLQELKDLVPKKAE